MEIKIHCYAKENSNLKLLFISLQPMTPLSHVTISFTWKCAAAFFLHYKH